MNNVMTFTAHTSDYSAKFYVKPSDDPSFIHGQDLLEDLETMMSQDFNRCLGRLNRIMFMSDSEFDSAFGGEDETQKR